MGEPSRVLASNLASLTEGRKKWPTRTLTNDRTLQALVTDLAAARVTAGMTQEECNSESRKRQFWRIDERSRRSLR